MMVLMVLTLVLMGLMVGLTRGLTQKRSATYADCADCAEATMVCCCVVALAA